MKKNKSKTYRRVTLAFPATPREWLASTLAPDLIENGKVRRHRSILDYIKAQKQSAKR